jgi:hypothetical protein
MPHPTLLRAALVLSVLALLPASAAPRTALSSSGRSWTSPRPRPAARIVPVRFLPSAQLRSRDPLTDQEIDQLRDTAQEPDKRLRFLVQFAQARMTALEQLAADPGKISDRGRQMHDLLEALGSILDEIDRNLDDYDRRNMDMRKGLQELIEADTLFQPKLRSLSGNTALEEESRSYAFILENVVETLDAQLQEAQQLLAEQEERIRKEKERQERENRKR